MLVIRLARVGRKKYPVYRIVAADSRRAATAKNIAILGHYNPHTKELVIKKDETLKYLGNGAQPSNAVAKLMKKDKLEVPAWVTIKTKARKVEATPELAEAAAAEVVAESVDEPVVVAEVAAENAAVVGEAANPADLAETVAAK